MWCCRLPATTIAICVRCRRCRRGGLWRHWCIRGDAWRGVRDIRGRWMGRSLLDQAPVPGEADQRRVDHRGRDLAAFTVAHSMDLVFEHPLWILTGAVAFGAYKTCARFAILVAGWPGRGMGKGPTLLLLRSFSIGKDSERLFDAIDKHWRRVGSIQMIAGVDLASEDSRAARVPGFHIGPAGASFHRRAAGAHGQRMSERDTVRIAISGFA